MSYLITSESVAPGHPDKVCDVISDTIVQEIISNDPEGRVAAECCAFGDNIIVGGETKSKHYLSVERVNQLAREAIKNCGYDDANESLFTKDETLYAGEAKIQVMLRPQSPEISMGVDQASGEVGAGDQGIMFGYANSENIFRAPQALVMAKLIMIKLWRGSKDKSYEIGPDIKTQVTLDYGDESNYLYKTTVPVLHSVVISFPVKNLIEQDRVKAQVYEYIKTHLLNSLGGFRLEGDFKMYVNNTGAYVKHSPLYDAGLTGRKIVVDSYGGYAPVGGGAQCFSADTLVKTAEGLIPISKIKPGTMVWCADEESYVLKLRPVNEVIENSVDDSEQLLEIELEDGTILHITENHEVFSETEQIWKPIGNFKIGEEVSYFNENFYAPKNVLTLERHVFKGNTLKEARDIVSEEQKRRSPLCSEYWIKKGYNSMEASHKVTEEQRRRSPASLDYYLSKGLSVDEAIYKQQEYQSSTLAGKSEEELYAIAEKTKFSLENCIRMYGEELGLIKYQESIETRRQVMVDFYKSNKGQKHIDKLKIIMSGDNNPNYGKLPPVNAGAGISGWYGDKLFRNLLELSCILYLEDNDVQFEVNETKGSEPLAIETVSGKVYYPDIILDKETVIEVKSVDNLHTLDIDLPSPYKLEILTEADIGGYKLEQIKQLYLYGAIEIHENKLERFVKYIGEL